jgi:micrococcal nuclease
MDILLQPTYRIFKKFFILCLLFAALAHNSPSFADAGYRVIRVVDGDTIVVDYEGCSEKVRMLCVDTPESVHPDKKQNIPMGKVASRFAKERLSGKYVGLEFEGHRFRDYYGRLLAYVIVDGTNFSLELVRQGMSPYYTKYGYSARYDEQFRALEKQARKEELGIWGDPELTRKYLRLKSKWGQVASRLE